MDRNRELRIYMKAACAKFDDGSGRHLSEDEMIAFCQERMAAPERETARSHLVRCGECLQLFRDARDFFDPDREGEPAVVDVEIRRGWKELLNHIRADEATGALFGRRRRAFAASRASLALAASVLLAIGLSAFLALLWRQERQERLQTQKAVEELHTSQQELLSRIKELEQSTKQTGLSNDERLKLESEKVRALESQLAALNQPQTNITEYELLLGSGARGSNVPYEIKVPPSARSLALKIMPDKPEEFASYIIELVDRQNRKVWKFERLNPDPGGSLIIAFPRAFLSEGKYRLRLYGWKGNTTHRVGEYDLTLTFSR